MASSAPQGEAAQVLLGDVGRPLPEEEEHLDLRLSRLGGEPVWLRPPQQQEALVCRQCGRHFGFIGQLYAGYEASHCRALHIFACLTPSCGADERSWCVQRSLWKLPAEPPDRPPTSAVPVPPPQSGMEVTAPAATSASPASAASAWAADASDDAEIEELLKARESRRGEASTAPASPPAPGCHGAGGTEEGAAGAAAAALCRGVRCPRGAQGDQGPTPFPAFALEIYDEPAALPKSGERELELLARYRRSEWAAEDAGAEAEAQAAPEALAVVDEDVAGDSWFMKFQRRLERSPRQVVRYSWGGKPLWISHPPEEASNSAWPPPCGRCGAPRIFELQLMPTLLYEVRSRCPELVGDSDIEWGTVLVYTCSGDCCSETPCREFVVVQPAV